MKILIITAAFPPMRGGESDHMLHLATRLAEEGHTVEVLTVVGAEVSEAFPFKVHPIMGDWSWSSLPRLAAFLRRCAPDGVLLKYSGWLYADHSMITFAPTLSKWLLPHAPFVTQFGFAGGAHPEKAPRASRAVRRLATYLSGRKDIDYNFGTLLRDSDTLIALGEEYARMLESLLPAAADKLIILPPPPILHMAAEDDGAAKRTGRQMLGFAEDDFVVAYFGVIYRTKGLETLLAAFQQVAKRNSRARLALIGGQSNLIDGMGYFNEIAALAKDLSIEDKIVAREYDWDSLDGSYYLRAADVCALPFDDGVTLIRSSVAGTATHGLPIITTRGQVLETPFVDERNMLLVEPKDPDALARAIGRVADDSALRSRLAQGASQLARDWFSWEKALRLTTEALQRRSAPGLAAAMAKG